MNDTKEAEETFESDIRWHNDGQGNLYCWDFKGFVLYITEGEDGAFLASSYLLGHFSCQTECSSVQEAKEWLVMHAKERIDGI